jgi:hypothetical protein
VKLQRKLQKLKEDGGIIPFDTKEDHNYIMRQIVMSYAFRVIRLIIIIFSVSYFIGTLWYILCWLTDDGVYQLVMSKFSDSTASENSKLIMMILPRKVFFVLINHSLIKEKADC